MEREALKLALEALEEIALAGMSGSGQESEEGMKAWHAQKAWEFIGIASRQLTAIKEALAQPAPSSVTYKEVAHTMNKLWGGTLKQRQVAKEMENTRLYTAPPAAQPAQEPVGTVQFIQGVTIGYLEKALPIGTQLYIAQPKRPWVSIDWSEIPDEEFDRTPFTDGATWAERHLKEKNT